MATCVPPPLPTGPEPFEEGRSERLDRVPIGDHELVVATVTSVGEGRLTEPALTYSSRKGWRIADTAARRPGESVRDKLLAMVDDAEE